MPLVGMRRTSRRVFGARVLRSGRRLLTAPIEAKHMRASAGAGNANGEEWIELLDNSGGGGCKDGLKCNGWKHVNGSIKQEAAEINFDDKVAITNSVSDQKIWGSVYRRKRKRVNSKNTSDYEDRKYGKHYVRKQWGKRRTERSYPSPLDEGSCYVESRVLSIVVEYSSCCRTGWLSCLLNLVLRYMTRVNLRLSQLSKFMLSESLAHVFSSHGIHFLRGSPLDKSSGICKIFGARSFVPLFVVDFSALPSCFMFLHTSLILRSACLPLLSVSHSEVVDDTMVEDIPQEPGISPEIDSSVIKIIMSGNDTPGKRNALKTSNGAPRITGRAIQYKTGVNSRSIQKRRSSLRSRRVKNSSVFRGRKANGALLSNLFSFRHDNVPLIPVKTTYQFNSAKKISALKSSLVELTQDIGSTSCSANILVIESAKCYRITGAVVKLEKSAPRKWSLAVKKDGKTMYSLSARKVMRPCSSNRVTHDIIWTEDNYSWKLEFPERRDWMIFKELYKECSDRNVQAPTANIIPVPGVLEVAGYAETNSSPFRRPDFYITLKDDELSRALAKETANYDMDSEDEEWLSKLNDNSSVGNEHWEHVSEEIFELIIDALEKAFFRSPDDYSDEKAAVDLCLHLGKKEVVEAVYGHWMKKRKQKRSALVRVFQFYQPRRSHLLSKPVIRKKRSFKRLPSRSGRDKLLTFLPVVAEEPDPLEEKKALLKVEEAKAATSRSVDAAVEKRTRAQVLMENADLATYKASMALRIAEAARIAESLEFADSFLLE